MIQVKNNMDNMDVYVSSEDTTTGFVVVVRKCPGDINSADEEGVSGSNEGCNMNSNDDAESVSGGNTSAVYAKSDGDDNDVYENIIHTSDEWQ